MRSIYAFGFRGNIDGNLQMIVGIASRSSLVMFNFRFSPSVKTYAVARAAAFSAAALAIAAAGGTAAMAGTELSNDLSRCNGSNGAGILVSLQGIKAGSGKLRVQSYPATDSAWLGKGEWLNRIEAPARSSNMQFCLPVSRSGKYAVAVRHDLNGNNKTDLTGDGGGFSNNPKISIFRAALGKSAVPVSKATFSVGSDVKQISIVMRYR
jgi:uncharacterized protein (DUF2141 family)